MGRSNTLGDGPVARPPTPTGARRSRAVRGRRARRNLPRNHPVASRRRRELAAKPRPRSRSRPGRSAVIRRGAERRRDALGAPAGIRASGDPSTARRGCDRLRGHGGHHRGRRHAAVGRGRRRRATQGRGDELRARRRLERARCGHQRAGHRVGTRCRGANPWHRTLFAARPTVELHGGPRPRPVDRCPDRGDRPDGRHTGGDAADAVTGPRHRGRRRESPCAAAVHGAAARTRPGGDATTDRARRRPPAMGRV